jgi:hypothetical protein
MRISPGVLFFPTAFVVPAPVRAPFPPIPRSFNPPPLLAASASSALVTFGSITEDDEAVVAGTSEEAEAILASSSAFFCFNRIIVYTKWIIQKIICLITPQVFDIVLLLFFTFHFYTCFFMQSNIASKFDLLQSFPMLYTPLFASGIDFVWGVFWSIVR